MNETLTIKDILLKTDDFFKQKKIVNSRYEAELLLAYFLKIDRLAIYLRFDQIVSEESVNLIRDAVIKRAKRYPLQYILNEISFLNVKLKINESVLIPRPETEYLCEMIVKEYSNKNTKKDFLDLCTGSGAIALSLKKDLPHINMLASDISEEALQTAKNNAVYNQLNIHFLNSDLFEKIDRQFDLIVSNPPYISEEEYQSLEPELFFEPKLALVSENKGLAHVFRILDHAFNYLKEHGILYLEIGAYQAEEISKYSANLNYKNVEIIKDLNQLNRFIRLEK